MEDIVLLIHKKLHDWTKMTVNSTAIVKCCRHSM